MAWTWDVIQKDWLLGGSIGVPPDEIVAAFNTAGRLLGDDWVDQHRKKPNGIVAGALPTLEVVQIGKSLAVVGGCEGVSQLLQRLKSGDRAAFSELKAIYLCSAGIDAEIEIEPYLQVEMRTRMSERKPDFRIRAPRSTWVYVEVAAPDVSEARQEAERVMQELASIFSMVPDNTALDLFLRRDPTQAEVELLKADMVRYAQSAVACDYDEPGLAIISVNMSHPSFMEPRDFGDELYTPRLGLARSEGKAGSPATKRVSVRYPYSDERAKEFLKQEAKQLSREEPGLIMLSLNQAPGAFKIWNPLLHRCLQPNQRTRVSGICLFQSGIETTNAGQNCVFHTSVIENQHALHSLPTWLIDSLKRFDAA